MNSRQGHIVLPFQQIQESRLRTDYSFRHRQQAQHHKILSSIALENLNIDMVAQVPGDYMPCVLLGVMKQLINSWINKRRLVFSISKKKINEISDSLLSITLPREFNRQPGNILEFERWKATELRHFLLYTGPVVLKDHISEVYYRHFMLFSTAVSILTNANYCILQNSSAKILLERFVTDFEKLYGSNSATFNVHSLMHLTEDCRIYNAPLDSFCAFIFENFLSTIKFKIKSGHLPLEQLYNRVVEYY